MFCSTNSSPYFLNLCACALLHHLHQHHCITATDVIVGRRHCRHMGMIVFNVVVIIGTVAGLAVVVVVIAAAIAFRITSPPLSTSSCRRARANHRPATMCPRASAAFETRW